MGRRRRVRDPALDKMDEVHGQTGSNALRDPTIDEERVFFTCEVDRIATFGKA